MLKGKKILLGITGSIAAYKSAVLIRLLVKEGAHVKVVMTESATQFATALSLSVLSKNPVNIDFASDSNWNNHVKLGEWADVFLIAPATANSLSKMAYGICDNLFIAVYLSSRCPVIIAPAMDLDMYKHPTTVANLAKLSSYGDVVIPAEKGELASGLEGEGRMAEPESLVTFLNDHFKTKNKKTNTRRTKNKILGKKALITAGPTYEAIDPVRFIGNHASGRMGFVLAEEMARRGAEVTLVTGPTNLQIDNPGVKRVDVVTAEDMYKKCVSVVKSMDLIIMSAAVADFTPVDVASQKVKKNGQHMMVKLKPTKDILKELGTKKSKGQFVVGFALETENEIKNAKAKIKKKNLDLIVLNSLRDKGAGFKTDTNRVTIIDRGNKMNEYELKSKELVAVDIANEINERIQYKRLKLSK
ncbi:MAG TPA: bifunctional phosphopantothenoylcysteine decarboxylase/phosphopantothenate--cysteine ligase CoaBC [Flavobacteriales bacterium]|nr:bifunctional phosphopantothenoylcysteine decarboxylase/phosphopantothenate--cysteine ligase CoaBC [Flavobacteriales bacterium]HIA10816.1 bifunctional phosphopantothenoylcysteine decarboxylase/phosphopantothenate--cysteine ligase CoaBC [Flavobacteriales bacterium]HIO71661.1 bifunctional phosphopantothenoylcysteine decarboxylase/phosphopantothenate--cysteine ligase CoaBC [Flavobacteriales bacterium]